jgi:hypothetical protein
MMREKLEQLPHDNECEMRLPTSLRLRSLMTECRCTRARALAWVDALERVNKAWDAWQAERALSGPERGAWGQVVKARRALAELEGQ